MKLLHLNVYGMIALVDVEFEDGRIKDWETWFCMSRPSASSLMPYEFIEGYEAYYQDELYRDGTQNVPQHPYRHTFLPTITKPEEYVQMVEKYNLNIYVARTDHTDCTQDDIDNILHYMSDFERRYSRTGCDVS